MTAPAAAQAREDPRLAQAHRLVLEGRCAAALELLAKLVRDLPNDPKPLVWTAQCQVERAEYGAARDVLERAVALDPEDGEARLLLAISLYHLEEFGRAGAELEAAAARIGEERAEIDLYRGLLLLARSGEQAAREGAAWLEHARSLDAGAVEPMASFYAGLGWSAARDDARARTALERVVREAPDTEWSTQAERLLAQLDERRSRVWGSLHTGFEYDSNAVLLGEGATLAEEISSQRDVRGIWQGQLGVDVLRRGPWAVGAAVSYSGAVYRDIDVFDSHFPGVALWADRRLGDATTLRLALDSGYAAVDWDDFLWTYRASLSAIQQWSEAGTSEAFARFWRDDFFVVSDDVLDGSGNPGAPCNPGCGPLGLDESTERNRDGNGFAVGWLHTASLPFDWPFGELTARAGYEYENFSARGTEYSYQSHTLAGGLRFGLPWSFVADLAGSFEWRPYRHPTTFPDPPGGEDGLQYALSRDDRNETTGQVAVTLERPVTRWLTAAVGWRYERNHSNAEVFDYEREVVGAYLTARLGH